MVLVSSICLFSTIIGCSNQEKTEPTKPDSSITSNNSISKDQNSSVENSSTFPKTKLSDSIIIDSVNKKHSIRAEQQTDKGVLLMISNGREEQGHLLVSSVLGQEGDHTFLSNYSIVYKQGEKETILLVLPNFQYIQPTDKKLPFEHISFKSADVYMLTPQYQTGHGAEGYLFAINKQSGDAFHLKIIKNGKISENLIYSEAKPLPIAEKDTLLVHPPIGAGTSEQEAKDLHYRLDLRNKQLIAE